MDPSLRQQEKYVPDESALDLDGSYYPHDGKVGGQHIDSKADFHNRSQLSANRSRRDLNTSQRFGSKSGMDISMDHEYLGKIDNMEQENRDYKKKIDDLKNQIVNEQQKQAFMQKENEQLFKRINDFELANKKNENLASERQQQLQYEIELKEQQVQVLHE